MIVEARIAVARQSKNVIARALGGAERTRAAAAGVCQSRCAAQPITGFEAFDVPRRNPQQLRGSGTRQFSFDALRDDRHPLPFLLSQRDCLPVHGVTFSRCR